MEHTSKKKIILLSTVFILVCILLLIGATTKATKDINLKHYFGGYEGAFVLYDESEDTYYMYNEPQCLKPSSPGETFEIIGALIALEVGIINQGAVQKWNNDIESSIYYKELVRQIGPICMQSFLDKIDYGNRDISGKNDEFWVESSLEISLIDQIEVLRKLYRDELPFDKKNMEFIRNDLINKQNKNIKLYGKSAANLDKMNLFIGYVERDSKPYFFATSIRGEHKIERKQAEKITLAILQDLELFKNKY